MPSYRAAGLVALPNMPLLHVLPFLSLWQQHAGLLTPCTAIMSSSTFSRTVWGRLKLHEGMTLVVMLLHK